MLRSAMQHAIILLQSGIVKLSLQEDLEIINQSNYVTKIINYHILKLIAQ